MKSEKRTVRCGSGGMAATRRLMRWRVGPQTAAMPATTDEDDDGGGNGQAALAPDQLGDVVQVELIHPRSHVRLEHACQGHADQAGNHGPSQPVRQDQQPGAQDADDRFRPIRMAAPTGAGWPKARNSSRSGERRTKTVVQVDRAVASMISRPRAAPAMAPAKTPQPGADRRAEADTARATVARYPTMSGDRGQHERPRVSTPVMMLRSANASTRPTSAQIDRTAPTDDADDRARLSRRRVDIRGISRLPRAGPGCRTVGR